MINQNCETRARNVDVGNATDAYRRRQLTAVEASSSPSGQLSGFGPAAGGGFPDPGSGGSTWATGVCSMAQEASAGHSSGARRG
jgi:hypothetical protein